ncbi:hypothetical protein VOLCADRAFT_119361 [Volvox carteri f. nagariensis]|uniref:Mitochondrial substrate carrier n=1 Tax=Volvox carteri f. nagariensis TaxID=3068 RepID=D8UCG9_VOLCA|nr:uncharacterized protein VOLCADRAFT_119361 [Volvox carteri f. nagariensis]EFJ42548.1 hypothetical protein VOLCADRAFT_119361 [Volvox carteri f. nagariensis]|eukprot:XP_002956404.1 hypothetical protein VOLCADRAFT_119361 [Volvox carteri f. nagariensis]
MGVLAALRHITATEGAWALWKGNFITIIHRIPYSATNFLTYEYTKAKLQGRLPNGSARAWVAGAVSGLVACTVAYPLDLLRTRIAADMSPSSGSSSSSSGGISAGGPQHPRPQAQPQILTERGVAGLYKGLGATLVQVVPGLAFNFCFYDTFKHLALKHQQHYQLQTLHRRQHHPEQQQQAVIRQVYERGALGRMRYLDVVKAVYAEGGVAAFYRGLGPEFAKVLPGMAIAFSTYESLKRLTGAA